MIKSLSIRRLLLVPFAAWSLLIVLPLIVMAWYAVTDDDGLFTLTSLDVIMRPGYLKSMWQSILLSGVTTILCLLVSYPLALFISEKVERTREALIVLCVIPLLMQSLLLTMAIQTLLEKNGVLNSFLRIIGLPDVHIINTPTAIVIGMLVIFLPYAILPIYLSLNKIDRNVIEAARDLGASPWQTFIKVQLPLSISGAVSAITLVFIPSLTTFFISALLGGNKILLVGNVIESAFVSSYDFHIGSALSLVLMIFVVLNIVLTMYFERDEEATP